MSTSESGCHSAGVGPTDLGVVSYERACSELLFAVKFISLGRKHDRREKRESAVYIHSSVADAR